MRGKNSDPRVFVFERAAKRLGLSGRHRSVARLYFLGVPVKQIWRTLKMPEGTLKTILIYLHGRLGTSNRPEFVHGIYAYGNGAQAQRGPRTHGGRSAPAPPA